ncbi:MAG TPA: SRPBCC domain-containing protein [Actinomycetota bacterium]
MTEDVRTEQSIGIDAPIDEVWAALTTPDQIEQWFLGVRTETDWRPGSPIVHRGEYQGKPYEDVGTILEFEPPRRLVHTHWSPVSGRPNVPESHEVVVWELAERGAGTVLTVEESNLASEEAKATSERTWGVVLENLKGFLESRAS